MRNCTNNANVTMTNPSANDSLKKQPENWMDHCYGRYDRRIQLLRGWVVKLRGAKAEARFGIGSGVQVWYPGYLTAGHDVTIMNQAFINCRSSRGVRIGNHTSFHTGFWLHCAENTEELGFFHIGSHCLIQSYGVMSAGGKGGITIGDYVVMGQMVGVYAGEHRFDDPNRRIMEQGTYHKGIVIEDDCWIGTKATILDGVTIGHGSVIGASSVVTRSIPPYSVAYGTPARVMRSRQTDKS